MRFTKSLFNGIITYKLKVYRWHTGPFKEGGLFRLKKWVGLEAWLGLKETKTFVWEKAGAKRGRRHETWKQPGERRGTLQNVPKEPQNQHQVLLKTVSRFPENKT